MHQAMMPKPSSTSIHLVFMLLQWSLEGRGEVSEAQVMHLRRAVTNESPLQILTESRSISAEEAMNSAKTRRGFLEILKEDNYEFIIQPSADITQNYEEAEAICKDQGGHVLDFSEEEITWQPEEEYNFTTFLWY